jgi:hypothetical protein
LVRRFLSPRWLVKHALMIVLVTTFLYLGWWQISRALAGNTLSVAYAAEWPLFALFVIAMWAREIRNELRPPTVPGAEAGAAKAEPVPAGAAVSTGGAISPGGTATPAPAGAPPTPGRPIAVLVSRPIAVPVTGPIAVPARGADEPADDDPALAAYNDYLAWLAADPSHRPSDYRSTAQRD